MILVDNKLGLYLNIKTILNNLFDFSSKAFKEINTIIWNGTYLTRKKEKIIRVDEQSDIDSQKGEELLFYIRLNKSGIFSLENPIPFENIPLTEDNVKNLNNKIWYVLNSNNPNKDINEDYFLNQNDIIKMGNIKIIVQVIKIKEEEKKFNIIVDKKIKYGIHLLNENGGPIFDFCSKPKNYYISLEESKKHNILCNICHKEECNIENPFLNFCNCNNYFHFKCLKKAFEIKLIENKNKTTRNYHIKGLFCKKCKLNYPIQFNITENKVRYELIDIDIPQKGNYMLLESLENKIYYGHLKFIFVIELNDQEIKIGRQQDNDIIISDPSISRQHSIMIYKNGKILIINTSEKFGTSILVKKSIKINDNKIKLQIGRSIIEARQMKYGEFEKLDLKNKIENLFKKD